MNFLDNMKEKNQFPILFIGSGITQRYFKDAPTWEMLLLNIWKKLYDSESKSEQTFYSYCNELRLKGLTDFEIYLTVADELEKRVDTAFTRGELEITNLTNEKSYKENISPFRQLIANMFSSLEVKAGMEAEINAFAKMIIKARFVVTTNYDTLIEDCFNTLNTKIDVKVGNQGLFESSGSYGELYKIHGTVKDRNSICITNSDYKQNREKLALVNAKLLSTLTNSPILFLGYSLTDENIKELLITYGQNLPVNLTEAVSRIGVVKWTEGETDIVSIPSHDSGLNVYYTQLLTDNYKELYEKVSVIDQGYLPSEIARYERIFRKIIEIKGPASGADTILASLEDVTQLNDSQIRNKNIVVAFGDKKYINLPIKNYADYIKRYFDKEDDTPLEIILHFFIEQRKVSTPIPFSKVDKQIGKLKDIPRSFLEGIDAVEERKIKYQKNAYIKEIKQSTKASISAEERLRTVKTPLEIWEFAEVNNSNKLKYIISKIDEFKLDDLEELVKKSINDFSESTIKTSDFRKIYMAYSLLLET